MGREPIRAAGSAPAAVVLRTNSALFLQGKDCWSRCPGWMPAQIVIVHQIVILLDFPSGKLLRSVE